MALTANDKRCLPEEKGWYLFMETAIYDRFNIEKALEPFPSYVILSFSELPPRIEKRRIWLKDLNFSHEWKILGTETVPNPPFFNYVYRLAGYEGGTPIRIFLESGLFYLSVDSYIDSQDVRTPFSPSRILDYEFVFCSEWECSYEYTVGMCDCPDKTKQQLASQDSPNPSEWSDRSWVDSEAGARGHCKHEFATYNYVEDPLPEPED